MSLRARFMRCVCVYQWVGPPAAPTVVGGGAGAAPDCVEDVHLYDIDPPEGGDGRISLSQGQG